MSAECNNGEIRLVDSSVPHRGRVEVCIRNTWSSVCSNRWDNDDAEVVCRQLGYTPTGELIKMSAIAMMIVLVSIIHNNYHFQD